MTQRLILGGLLAAFATGAAMAQSAERASFTAALSPSSENPPVETVDAGGTALVLIHMTRNTDGDLTQAVVDFHIDVNTEASVTATAMHIHRGVRGVNGPVVIDSIFGSPIELTPGSRRLFRQNVVTSETGLAVVEALLAEPHRYYVNMHSTANPSGFIRGQLEPTDASAISDLMEEIEALHEENAELAEAIDKVNQTIARIARRVGVVPVE